MLRRVLPTCSRLRREMAMGMATKATDDTHITSAAVREAKLLVSTRDCVEGRQIVKELGVVSATVVRTKNILEDILAALGGMFGGETRSYSSLMNETTQEAIHRLKGAALVGPYVTDVCLTCGAL
ncbi:hypothetical protein DYB37_002484 [Aphanomyces astaci]|uniref:Uncharacterized protein n=1 Tax=Aphanomyces astaci TaxID=112090 RepID=A0A397DM25_APHAT|nr:hypothetical protein DYB25_001746 [Aphanomyces astaci]RHY61670.1 hypothetical protein DYB30_001464 [Aphanomyces astaci]RHY64515.1 hypothetical protein DYB38_000631 [Aphanomyces astaci]RHY96403.1 hypothetical protein DYB35_001070 [Aphanomyces astaci]RHZ16934.1 hypothetical protein DYB31_008100 [Aphanomyces astaci]